MPALDGMTGIVLGAIFGSVFVITCIISAIKAVRDRSRIKKQRHDREMKEEKDGFVDFMDVTRKSPTKAIPTSSIYNTNSGRSSYSESKRNSNGTNYSGDFAEHLDLSVYSISAGMDNLTFQRSYSNIIYPEESNSLSADILKSVADTVPSCQSLEPQIDKPHDANFCHERNLDNISKKIMRRHSYEIAVSDHSWLPKEPTFSSSETTSDVYNSSENEVNNTKSLKVVFENKAYDNEDTNKK